MPASDMNTPVSTSFDGGTEADREQLLFIHHEFLRANDVLDYERLKSIWDDNPENRHYNTNGHTYDGLPDWENIWNFYRPQFRLISPYSPGRVRIVVRGDMACISADHVSRHKEWIGRTTEHNPSYYRATQVAVREADGWKVIHAHFSVQDTGPRPDLA